MHKSERLWNLGKGFGDFFSPNNSILEFMNIRETGKSKGEAGLVYFSRRVTGGFVFFLFYF